MRSFCVEMASGSPAGIVIAISAANSPQNRTLRGSSGVLPKCHNKNRSAIRLARAAQVASANIRAIQRPVAAGKQHQGGGLQFGAGGRLQLAKIVWCRNGPGCAVCNQCMTRGTMVRSVDPRRSADIARRGFRRPAQTPPRPPIGHISTRPACAVGGIRRQQLSPPLSGRLPGFFPGGFVIRTTASSSAAVHRQPGAEHRPACQLVASAPADLGNTDAKRQPKRRTVNAQQMRHPGQFH